MIEGPVFHILNDTEKSQYKFKFCKGCIFHECELIAEYEQFRRSHSGTTKRTTTKMEQCPTEADAIKGKAVRPEDCDLNCGDVMEGHFACVENQPYGETGEACLSYDWKKIENGCLMSPQYVVQVECGTARVSEGIGEHFKLELDRDGDGKFVTIKAGIKGRWEPAQPIFISAQTGQGKNYFIENTMIPYVRELNIRHETRHKVLIISNRLALKRQVHNRLKGLDVPDDVDEEVYTYGDYADVVTYQSLLIRQKKLKYRQEHGSSRYLYVICDEAHFFTSDASFNPHTEKILDAIISTFQNAVRIYMSATPYECLRYIISHEKKHYELTYRASHPLAEVLVDDPMPAFYHFKRDYSYLDVKAYSKMKDLFNKIVYSVRDGEKWLIFIDDKAACRGMKQALEEHGEEKGCPMVEIIPPNTIHHRIYAVSAESKKDPDYLEILEYEKLIGHTRVLISTSVLDNGVNLRDIDHIVVSDMSKAKVLQMVGRARVGEDKDTGLPKRKTLYLPRFKKGDVNGRKFDCMRREDAYHAYDMAFDCSSEEPHAASTEFGSFLDKFFFGDERDWHNGRHWFGHSKDKPAKLYINQIARDMLERQISMYEAILAEMQKEPEKEVGQKYLEHQLSWFGKMYCEATDKISPKQAKAKQEFLSFIETYVGKKLYKKGKDQINESEQDQVGESDQSDQDEFRRKFTELHDLAFGRVDKNASDKRSPYGIVQINKCLEMQNLCFRVRNEGKPVYWIVVKAAEDSGEADTDEGVE